MVKHTQAIRRLLFDHFVRLALKGLKPEVPNNTQIIFLKLLYHIKILRIQIAAGIFLIWLLGQYIRPSQILRKYDEFTSLVKKGTPRDLPYFLFIFRIKIA